jgi:hypothetical protein
MRHGFASIAVGASRAIDRPTPLASDPADPSAPQAGHRIPTFPLAHNGAMADTSGVSKRAARTKKTDSKGRLTLGEAFANRTVIVEERGNEIVLHLARVIPEGEAWLYDNPTALAAVRRGLKQARSRALSDGPDLAKAARLAEKLGDD